MLIAIARADGGVSLMTLAAGADAEAEIAKWRGVHAGEHASHRTVDVATVPADRAYRNAWRLNGSIVDHDMAKARELHRDKMRLARAPLLAALDVESLRALEDGDQGRLADVKTRKQALRDVTADPAIEAAATIEELRAVWPEALDAAVAIAIERRR